MQGLLALGYIQLWAAGFGAGLDARYQQYLESYKDLKAVSGLPPMVASVSAVVTVLPIAKWELM